MNCLFLVLLLLCCGNDGSNGCGCFGGLNCGNGCGRDHDRDRDRGRDRNRDRDRNDGCGCDRDRDRNDGCDRDRDRDRNDGCGCDNRPEPRPFIPYPGPSCGCEEPKMNSGCNCAN